MGVYGSGCEIERDVMKSESIDLAFEAFISKISLTKTDCDRIESAYRGLTRVLESKLSDGGCEFEYYRQGSFENGTVVSPLDGGEYDVDIVVEYEEWPDQAKDTLDFLASTVKENRTYSSKVRSKRSCVRVEYASNETGKFHVDLVPARPFGTGTKIEVPREGEGWHVSDPRAFSEWCEGLGEQYRNVVKIFKRWRDENETTKASIKSIQLQVLVAEAMSGIEAGVSLPSVVRDTFKHLKIIISRRDTGFSLWNPVLPQEDLASSWSESGRKSFERSLDHALELINGMERSQDEAEVFDYWKELLGRDFPDLAEFEVEEKASTSHRMTPSSRGWAIDANSERALKIQVEKEVYGRKTRPLKTHEKRALEHDSKLKFSLSDEGIPLGSEVWWQVTNTGKHADSVSQLRGTFIPARARNLNSFSDNQFVHWENTAYHGTHTVQAFVVKHGVLWGRSNVLDIRVANVPFWRKMRKMRDF